MTRSYNVTVFDIDSVNQQYQVNGHLKNVSNVRNAGKCCNRLPWKTKIFYSIGHIYNDLCASIWFSYTLLFFQLHFNSNYAALLLLLGQIADALATPFIGFQSDRTDRDLWICRYGKRKTWHLIGTLLVTCSFPFIFNVCIGCEDTSQTARFIYYGSFIILFQFGWAAVQVSHVALITDLTPVSTERVALNSYRQACTVASSICVYSITLLVLGAKDDSTISEEDSKAFTKVVYIICGIGIIFSTLFHIFVKEPNSIKSNPNVIIVKDSEAEFFRARINHHRGSIIGSMLVTTNNNTLQHTCDINSDKMTECIENGQGLQTEQTDKESHKKTSKSGDKKWSDWLKSFSFYQVAFIYMMSRLYVNLTQVYTPLYLQKTLKKPKGSIAIIPFVTYVGGFFCSMISKPISGKLGSKILLTIGCMFGLGSCVWINFGSYENESYKHWQLYGVSLFFGIGGTTMLIASLAITADLIGNNAMSGAFVFGVMSFFDKLLNGSTVVLLEQFNKDKSPINDSGKFESIKYYQTILVFVSGGAVLLTMVGLGSVWRRKFINNANQECKDDNQNDKY